MTIEQPDPPTDPDADPPHAGHGQPIGVIDPLQQEPDEPAPLKPRPLPRSKVPGPSSGAPAPDPANRGRPQ